jgi:hypothetical protein
MLPLPDLHLAALSNQPHRRRANAAMAGIGLHAPLGIKLAAPGAMPGRFIEAAPGPGAPLFRQKEFVV